MRVAALLPAAGKSVRMGTPKLALPLGNSTVLECVLESLRQAGVEDRLVVVTSFSKDITERRQAEERFRQQLEDLRSFMHQVAEGNAQ